MTRTPRYLIETLFAGKAAMDALGAILSSMKLSGSVFLQAEFTHPWCVSSRILPEDCTPYFPQPQHVISYHYVRSGEMLCAIGGGSPVRIGAGHILLLPRNELHFLGSDLGIEAINARDLIMPPGEGSLVRIEHGGGGRRTQLFCGFLGTLAPVDTLLLNLPSLLAVNALECASGAWLASSIRFASEKGQESPEMLSRLAELLFAEAVKQHFQLLPAEGAGWFAGLRDPHVGRALSLIHDRCVEGWTTETLAREAGLSRSAFADRFTRLLGEPPMHYVARHRMNVAANLLREGRENVCNIAYSIGFNSEAAFNRAFKKEFGVPPGVWKKRASATKAL